MANKTITLGQNITQDKFQSNSSEIYIDVNMKSKPVTINQHFTVKQDPSIYYALLGLENSDVSVVTEQTFANIVLFTDDNYSIPNISSAISSFQSFQVDKLVNVNAIKNSLHQIFTWIPGERILLPEFGSNLRKLLYEGITDYNVEQIVSEIRHCVSEWEPRVQILKVVDASTIDDTEDNTVHIEVLYTIPGLTGEQIYSEPITFQKRG